MRVPFATVIHVEHVPAATRRRLRAILTHHGPVAPTATAERSLAGPVLLALAAAAVAAGVIARLTAGDARLDAAALVAMMVAVAAAGGLAVRAVARVSLWARLPFAPGCYVIGAYVVDATSELLRITPIVRTHPAVRRRLGRYWLVLGGDHPIRIALGRHGTVERVLTWIHGDLVAYSSALASGDRTTAGHLDPLAEARDRDGTVIGTPGPLGARHRALAPAIAALVAAVAVVVATPAAWWLVNRDRVAAPPVGAAAAVGRAR